MFDRKRIKATGKERFKANYWYSVITAFIFNLFFVSSSAAVSNKKDEITTSFGENGEADAAALVAALVVLGVLATTFTIMFIIKLFLLNPLKVGCNRFFLVNQDEKAALSEIGHSFKTGYINSALGLFLTDIIIGLAYCLFVIPGCILTYSYRLVPYILADDPTVSAVDALKKSRAMMNGYKWKAFVYDLSFIGWFLLAAITCGILNFFYVSPYKYNADAALYKEIKGAN